MPHPRIYIDAEGVERGYYVYAHTCKASGRVFYVGKGKLDRAWSDSRSRAWQEYVATLSEGYEVCLLHKDLTEDESIKLERIEIEAQGGAASVGGTLVNWIEGEYGDGFGVAGEVVVDLRGGDEGAADIDRRYWETYQAVRKFKELSQSERKACAEKFSEMVDPALEVVLKVNEDFLFRARTMPPPEISSTINKSLEIGRLSRQLRNRKMRYFDFCYAVQSQLDQLGWLLEGGEVDPEYLGMIKAVYLPLVQWFSFFDTGNRREAEEIAGREWKKMVDDRNRSQADRNVLKRADEKQAE